MRRLVDKVSEISPLSDGTKPHSGGDGDGYFGSSTLIILAALLCALICVLGLNSILRCAIRCGHRRLAFETPEGAAAATGLKKKALRQIPMTVYGPGAGITTTDCSICLREFEGGEKVRVLPRCGHGFHVKCIDTWLALQSSCPTCRRSLLLHQDNGAAVVVVDEPAN